MISTYGSVAGKPALAPLPGRVDKPVQVNKPQGTPQPPEAALPRSLNYYADYSGCGHWRMIWPENVLNASNRSIIHGSSVMVLDERYYGGIDTIRIQRQATESQQKFLGWMRQLADKNNFKLVYEIDDICFREDIPDYNKFKFAFDKDEIRKAVTEMMLMTDEMTVTCPFMKEYYEAKTGHKNITVIPNYMPKFWIGNHYEPRKVEENYRRNLKKPRILYAGSGAHFDIQNKVGQQDDFHHVLQAIVSTIDKYQWVFMGAYPMSFRDLLKAGKMEFHPWVPLYKYPERIKELKVNAMVAPLQNNNFNKAKSNLKFIEACALGLPIVCQDMCTYEDAFYKFNTGDEMIDQLKTIFSGLNSYMRDSKRHRQFAENLWLEDNIEKYYELYKYPYGSKERVQLNKLNNIVAV